jgi:hypothetical protein
MTAAYRQIDEEESAFDRAEAKFAALGQHMRSPAAFRMQHGDIEAYVIAKTREIACDMAQGHMDLRSAAEHPVRVVGSDGIERKERRGSVRQLRLLVGVVTVPRLLYQAAGVAGMCPQDAALSLPADSFSVGVRRRVVDEVCRGSFDHAAEMIRRTTGSTIAKRQIEQLAQASVLDFEAFYASRAWVAESDDSFLVLTFDGAGIIMRTDSLRLETRREAEKAAKLPKAWPDRTKSGEKPNRRRMAEVASVYSLTPHVRTADDVVGELASVREARPSEPIVRPRPVNKRVWASVERSMADVIDEGFREALRRDPDGRRRWIVVVDGQDQQLEAVSAAARRHGVNVTIVCDFIHTMEYMWKAAHEFHPAGSEGARQWVADHARLLLEGADPSQVAAGMRRSATLRRLKVRKAVDKCARYLIKRRAYLRYGTALEHGYPIASGVIEGACRHLVRDRLDCCGARWSVKGAEAVLKLRALASSGDLDVDGREDPQKNDPPSRRRDRRGEAARSHPGVDRAGSSRLLSVAEASWWAQRPPLFESW